MKLDHMVIYARDLAASVRFYDALLPLIGFDKGREHVYLNGDGLAIDLRPAPDDAPRYSRWGAGLNHYGFTAASRRDVDRVRKQFAKKGFDVPEVQIFDNGDYALFLPDPDGLRIEVTAHGD